MESEPITRLFPAFNADELNLMREAASQAGDVAMELPDPEIAPDDFGRQGYGDAVERPMYDEFGRLMNNPDHVRAGHMRTAEECINNGGAIVRITASELGSDLGNFWSNMNELRQQDGQQG